MESQKPKIALYAKRTFGEKLNVSFDFIKENWKLLLKAATYLILPLCLIQALTLNSFMGSMLNSATAVQSGMSQLESYASMGAMYFVNYIGYIVLSMIGSILLSSLVYAMMQKYNESEERLQGVTLKTLKPLLLHNMGRLFKLTLVGVLFGIIVIAIVGALTVLSPFTLILTFPLLIACAVPLCLLAPVYLFEKVSVMGAFKKTYRLGFATWGGILAISLIMGLIASVLQGVTMVPWYVATLVKYFFAMSDTGSETTVSVGYSFVLYLLGIIQTYGTYLSMIFSLIGLAYQYGHASEVVDSVTVEEDIDNFDKL